MTFIDPYQDGDYLARTEDWHEGDAHWKAAHVAALLKAAGVRPARVADTGCGTGGVLVQLQAMLPPQTDFTGFEIAEPAFHTASGRGNAHLHFVHGDVTAATIEPFDLMLAMDVFEHVPDYLGFLEDLRGKARRFVFHIPLDLSVRSLLTDLPMYRRRTVGHLHYFTAETARATLEDCGYRVVQDRFTHAILQPAPVGWKRKLRTLPDRAFYAANPALCARVLGGCSLLVLAEPAA